jgi:GAF domain-containing protein
MIDILQAKLPESMTDLFVTWKCEKAAFIPLREEVELSGLMILGDDHEKGGLTQTSVQPYANLAEMAGTALAKVAAQSSIEARLNELQTLNQVSQAIAAQADLDELYRTIHDAVSQVMGSANFLIALYDAEKDQIHIPYMFEDDRVLRVDPFPLGEGLTSIVIRNKHPLLLTDLNEDRLKELGAKMVGSPAKSWLGAPLIVSGECIGVLVVQDLEQENRFSQADLRLLTTLSAQVAGSIHNAFLLNISRKQAERERFLHEVTTRIRNSINRNSILETTAVELSRMLNARGARIEIGPGGDQVKGKEASE